MRRSAIASFAFLFTFLLGLTLLPDATQAQPAHQQGISQDAIIEGGISVKLDPPATASAEASINSRGTITRENAQGVPLTGVSSVDALNRQFAVTEMERIFRPAGKFEQRHREAGLHRWYTVRLPAGASMQQAVQAYNSDPNVTVAELRLEKTRDVLGMKQASQTQTDEEPSFIPDDPEYETQWHYDNTSDNTGTPDADINLPEAHDIETGNSDVVISVVDGGLDLDHPDFDGMLWTNEGEIPDNGVDDDNNGFVDDVHGYDHADNDGEPDASGSHGTHVAGTVAAKSGNGQFGAGVAGGNGSDGSGIRLMINKTFGTTNDGFAEGVVYAADNGAIVSQNSWGYSNPGAFEQAVLDAIDYFNANAGGPDAPMNGGIYVNAAGNSDDDGEWYPGFYEGAFAVSATNPDDGKAGYSNFGDWVEVAAPGGSNEGGTVSDPCGSDDDDVWSTVVGGFGNNCGTSMAAPHVSGVIGLITSASPGLSSDEVKNILIDTGVDVGANEPIGPRIDAAAALQSLDPDDETPPEAISDLAATAQANNVELTWTAPADDAGDPGSGPVAAYSIRYSTDGPIDESNFDDATPVSGAPSPSEPGETETTMVTGLDFETEYWFAVQATDDNANTSLSNSPSATTADEPSLAFSPEELSATIDPNETVDVTLTVENEGPATSTLEFWFPGFAAMDLLSQPGVERNNTSSVIGDASYVREDGDPHAGIGHPIVTGAGGPDDFGYSWIDSNEPGGPSFDWEDISDVGTALGLTDDFGASPTELVSLPFTFDFYGESQEEVRVDHNGFLYFEGPNGNNFGNDEIPNSDLPNGVVAAFWDDLDPDLSSATVYTYHDADNNRFIVQWDEVPAFPGSEGDPTFTFQIILNQNGSIQYQYLNIDEGDDDSATTGIEDLDGQVGLQIAFNTSYVEDELAVEIAATPDFIADVDPASGFLDGGQSEDVTVTFDSDGIEPGTYENDLVLASNDPNASSNVIPSTLNVDAGAPPQIALDPTSLDFGEVLEGSEATQSFTIINEGGAPLEVSSLSSDNADFTLSETGPITIPFEGTHTIDVTFSPDDVGTSSGTITVESDDPDNPEATVDVTGEGVPAPAIAVDPSELMQELLIGETAEQTLTVSNTGGSDLQFEAMFQAAPSEDLVPSDVAATAPDGGSGDAPAAATARSDDSSPSGGQPLDAMDAVYQLDDGSSENALGLGGLGDDFDMMWINAFEVIEGAGTITSISTAWGCADPNCTGPELPDGKAAAVYVYDDPNNDGDPTDAELLTSEDTEVMGAGTDEFTTVDITPTDVEGTFFIAVLVEDNSSDWFPAPMDESSTYQGASWFAGTNVPNTFDDENLANNPTPPTELGGAGLPANWLLRADAGASFVAVEPAEGTVAPGEDLDLTATFDATGLDVGLYEGDIVFESNDPANPSLDVPATLDVTSAPYPFELSPASHDVTVDVPAGDDEVQTREVTITNTTDESQSFTIATKGAAGNAPQMSGERMAQIDEALQEYARQHSSAKATPYADEGSGDMPHQLRDRIGQLAPVGVTAHGAAYFGDLSGQLISFDLGEPDQLQDYAPLPETGTAFAGDFLLGDDDTFYAIDNDSRAFLAIDAETGDATQLGTSTPESEDETWAEIATDPTDGTVYASTTDNLYTLDPETGEVTLVGSFGMPDEIMIAIAVDTDGVMYGHGISQDMIYRINKTTGEAIEIGPTGVDASFAQGMDFDPKTGQLYMAWYQGSGVGGLRTVDTETGETELVGPFQGNEIGFMAIPSAGFISVPGLSAGTLNPGGSVTIDVTVDATNLIAGTYEADLDVTAEVPGNPVETVPFMLEVIADPMASIDPGSLEFEDTFVNDTSSQEVVFSNTGRDVLEVAEVSVSEGFVLADEVPSTIEPGQFASLEVLFTPTAVQDYSGTLTIESNAPNAPTTVELSGTGIEAPVATWDPTSFEVQAYPGQQYERTLTLGNEGGNPLEFVISEDVVDAPSPEPSAIFELMLLEEDFEGGTLPEDWDRTQAEGADGWQIGDDLGSFFWSVPDHTIYAASNDDACNCDSSEDYIITPSIDFSDLSGASLAFDSYYTGDFSQLAFVEVSTDGGETFEVVEQMDPADEWVRRTVDLSAYAGESDVRVAFHADDAGVWASGWAVDNVQVKQSLEFLTVEPTEGTVDANSSQEITYSLDATGLPAGQYQVDYTFSTNDPTQQTKTIPFTIDVIESLTVTPEPDVGEDGVVHPNEEFSVPIVVESLDDLAVQSFEFALTFDGDLVEATGVETDGTLSEGLTLATNIGEDEVQVAAADQSTSSPTLFTIEGSGDLVIVNFKAKEMLGTSDLEFSSMQFNEGEPPVSTGEDSVEIAPLYGDVTFNQEVSALDASKVLDYAVGLVELSDAALTAGDVSGNGSLSAFDAAHILDYVTGVIDCFPVEEGCESTSTVAAKRQGGDAQQASEAAGTLAWGEVADGGTNGAQQKVTLVPLTLEESSDGVRAVQLTTELDAEKVEVAGVTSQLPDDWQVSHHFADDGTLQLALAGSSPLQGEKLATVKLHWLQSDTRISMAGTAQLNESAEQVLADAEVSVIPDEFALGKNYPNPFTRSTTIEVDLPKEATVSVEVFDVLGRRTLQIDEKVGAGSDHTITIDGTQLSPGLYVYRVTAEMDGATESDTGRMTFVK